MKNIKANTKQIKFLLGEDKSKKLKLYIRISYIDK